MSAADRFTIKDSGERAQFAGGMVRDTEDGKPRLDLLVPEGVAYEDQFLYRLGIHMAKGAAKYAARNWERACDAEALARYRSSAFRHLLAWMTGKDDEDHAAAVVFNVLAHETIKGKIEAASATPDLCPACQEVGDCVGLC